MLALIDFIGFFNGCSYQIEISQCVIQGSNDLIVFGKEEPCLNGLIDSIPLEGQSENEREKFIRSVLLAIEDEPLKLALADRRRSISSPNYTTMYCYKALENIRVYFQENKKKSSSKTRVKGTDLMEEKLKILPKSIQSMQEDGGAPRHGVVGYTSEEKRAKYLTFTWKVIERYIIYKLNNNELPNLSEYELLKL